MRIEQDGRTIKIDRQYGRGRELDANRWTFTVKLDGSPSPYSGPILMVREGLARTVSSTATWAADGLVISTTTTTAGTDTKEPKTTQTVREKLSFQRTTLLVERSAVSQPKERPTGARSSAGHQVVARGALSHGLPGRSSRSANAKAWPA